MRVFEVAPACSYSRRSDVLSEHGSQVEDLAMRDVADVMFSTIQVPGVPGRTLSVSLIPGFFDRPPRMLSRRHNGANAHPEALGQSAVYHTTDHV